MTLARRLAAVCAALAIAGPACAEPLDPPPGMTVERVVMLFRHGVRAPIEGEADVGPYASQPWPQWSTPAEQLTPHGAAALRLAGRFDRALLSRHGLLPAAGCPSTADLWIWTNTAERTIASGEAMADGLAPGCRVAVGRLAPGRTDPLFDPGAAAPFDPAAALASMRADGIDLDRLVQERRDAFTAMEDILGCRRAGAPAPCDLASLPSTLTASADGRGLNLTGPARLTAGAAQVILLQYAEGLPAAQVGWGRATPARIAKIARLHALQMHILYGTPYMARRWAWALGPALADLLSGARGARASILVGHDDNIVAVAALLDAHIDLPGYGEDDPPPGGALGFEVLRRNASGQRFVRMFYQAQSLEQLRRLTPLTRSRPPILAVLRPSCAAAPDGLCALSTLKERLNPAAASEG